MFGHLFKECRCRWAVLRCAYLHTFFCEGALSMTKILGTIPTGTLS